MPSDTSHRLAQYLSPPVTAQGRIAALRVVVAFVGGCVVWSAAENAVLWRFGHAALPQTAFRVVHDGLLVTVLGLTAYHGALYAISKLEEARREVERADAETVGRFARAAELMDPYRRGHNMRIGMYSREIARAMGQDEAFCEDIMRTAMLHDIGEIGVPDALRNKAEPLTAFERLRMMRHVEFGGDLLTSDRRLLAMAYRIARHHHESWDGLGYPDGLQGEEIPLEARIVAVADVFDALVSNRPHRAAYSPEFALDEIRAQAGKRFDYECVTAFESVWDQILAIHHAAPTEWPESVGAALAHA